MGEDAELVAARVGEVEPPPSGELVGTLDDLAAGGLDGGLRRLQVFGVDEDEGAARPGLTGGVEAADLTVARRVADAGVGIAVVVELPAECRAVEGLGSREVMGVDLDVADDVVDFVDILPGVKSGDSQPLCGWLVDAASQDGWACAS